MISTRTTPVSRIPRDLPPSSILLLTTLSNVQLSPHAAFNSTTTLVIIQSRLNPLIDELVYLLRSPPNETLRVKEGGEILFDRVEVGVSLDPLDEIVLEPKLLDLVGGLMG